MGKHKYIETPQKMWDLFEAYKKQTKENPRTKIEYVGKDGKRVETPLETPLTIEGFYGYCYENVGDAHHYFENTDKRYDDYRGVCSRVREFIRQDQITGGLVGQYNASITQRLNNLAERTHNTNVEQPLFGPDPE